MTNAKPRSAKQSEQNAKLTAAAKLLKNAGLKGSAPDLWTVIHEKESGKSDEAILANMKIKQNANAATRKNAKTAKAATAKATTVKATTVKVAAVNGNGNGAAPAPAPKVKSNAKVAAATAQKNLGTKFKNQGLKFYPAAVKYFTEQKKTGKANDAIFAEIKARSNLQAAPIRTKKNVAAVAAANTKVNGVVPGRAVTVTNKGAVKGQWVCEKCRLVANNTTRKNNNKKNNKKNNGSFTNVNAYMYE